MSRAIVVTGTHYSRENSERAQNKALRTLMPFLAELSPEEVGAIQQALPALRRVLTRDDQEACSGSQST